MSKKLLPDILKKDERLKAFAELEVKNFKEVSAKLPYLFVYKLENLSDSELEELAWQFDISKVEWELATDRKQKEELIKNNILLKAKRGTPWAVKKALSMINIKAKLTEWFETNGELPPYTFIVQTDKPPSDVEKLIALINEYKNLRSKLYAITDGNCKKTFRWDISFLDGSIFDDLQGQNINGVRVCFLYKTDLSTKVNKPSIYINNTSKQGDYTFYSVSPTLDNIYFDEADYKTLLVELNLKSTHEFKAKYEPLSGSFKDLSIFDVELSDEGSFLDNGTGFIGEVKTTDNGFFDEVYFDNVKGQVIPVLSFNYLSQTIKTNPIKTSITSHTTTKIKRPVYINFETKVSADSISYIKTRTNAKAFKRNWTGFWKGNWNDDYQIQTNIEVN